MKAQIRPDWYQWRMQCSGWKSQGDFTRFITLCSAARKLNLRKLIRFWLITQLLIQKYSIVLKVSYPDIKGIKPYPDWRYYIEGTISWSKPDIEGISSWLKPDIFEGITSWLYPDIEGITSWWQTSWWWHWFLSPSSSASTSNSTAQSRSNFHKCQLSNE